MITNLKGRPGFWTSSGSPAAVGGYGFGAGKAFHITSPTDIANLYARYRGDDVVPVAQPPYEAGQVEGLPVWPDTINGLDLSQATVANQPTLMLGATGLSAPFGAGRRYVIFDGAAAPNNDYLAAASAAPWKFLHDGTGCTLVMVLNLDGTTSRFFSTATFYDEVGIKIAWAATNPCFVISVFNGTGAFGPVVSSVANSAPVGKYVFVFRYGDARFDLRLNRVSVDYQDNLPSAPSAAAPTFPLTMGREPGSDASPLAGQLPEILLYNRYLNGSEVAALEDDYIGPTYGV